RVRLQGFGFPWQAPSQRTKYQPLVSLALRVTTAPGPKVLTQPVWQAMPLGLMVTWPCPCTATVSLERSAVLSTVVRSVTVLFPSTGSASLATTRAVLVRSPGAEGFTVMV